MTTETIKLQLVQNIISLPENKLAAASEFINHLVSDNLSIAKNGVNGATLIAVPEDNPMLKFIGLASYEPSVVGIDEELYGGQSR
ncbi:MAG: hypothetical protein ACKVZH_08660 [Blastocatellia bacterium]